MSAKEQANAIIDAINLREFDGGVEYTRNEDAVMGLREPFEVAEAYLRQSARLTLLEEALRSIQAGNWNFGNLKPGQTVMEFAAEVLGQAGGSDD